MASNVTIAHRFANKDYNFERGLQGSNTHISGKNYYSYSTVFGQWVDEKVCVVYWGATSITSHKHKLYPSCFPKDVTVLPYDDGGSRGYYCYHGCNLIGWGEFDERAKMTLMYYWFGQMYDALATINGGKKKDLDKYAGRVIEEYLEYSEKLCGLYREVTIPKFIKYIKQHGWKDRERDDKAMKKMVTLLKDGERDIKTLVDAMFGEGTYNKYWDYCGRYRKTEDKKNKIIALCNRLGIEHPYERWQGYEKMKNNLSAADIRKLTAKERNEIHFKALAYKERKDNEKAYLDKVRRNKMNAYRWITGYEQEQERWGSSLKNEVRKCRNKYSGREYSLPSEHIFGFYWCDENVKFSYESFVDAEDKEAWIRNFYEKCELVEKNAKAISVLKSLGADIKPKEKSYDDDQYILNRKIIHAGLDAETLAIVEDFIARQDKHFADEEARKRAEKIARLAREEERRKEKELQESIKKEQIEELVAQGIEGCRDLWRKHFVEVYKAKEYADVSDEEFYHNGNVLMRFSVNKDKIETSKMIVIDIPTCKKMWKLVSLWHEHPEKFRQCEINTHYSGKYTISSYDDDILTAGCHDIAYAEMERMYNEIIANENVA